MDAAAGSWDIRTMNQHHYYIGLLLILLVFGFELLIQPGNMHHGEGVQSYSSPQQDRLLVSR